MFKSKLRVLGIILGLFFILFLVFASISGENHRTENIVEAYFTDIKNKKYDSLSDYYTESGKSNFSSLSQTIEFHVLLELALQKYFNIKDLSSSEVFIKRNNFWIPFITEPNIQLNIAFQEKQNEGFWSNFTSNDPSSIQNFITLKRDNGVWKIETINIEKSKINNVFEEIKADKKVNNYLFVQGNELIIKSANIDLNKTSMQKRKKLIHELESAIEAVRSINQ